MDITQLDWAKALEEKHGLPLEKCPGTVYILHWNKPTTVLSVSMDYGIGESIKPITHYVGWTSQADPKKRYNNHSRVKDGTRHNAVYTFSGTMEDEEKEKHEGNCPLCNEHLSLSLFRR